VDGAVVPDKYQCCFCGLVIDPIPPDVGGLLYSTLIDRDEPEQFHQQLFCHRECLQDRLHRSARLYAADLASGER
jgi:hypothetical protein